MADFTIDTTLSSLPALGTMQFHEDERSDQTEAAKSRSALGPLLVSVCLHALGLYGLVDFHIEAETESNLSSGSIHVQIIPPPQALAPEVPQALHESTETELGNESTVSAPPEVPALPQPLVDLPQQTETLVTVNPMQLPNPDSLAPTQLNVRQMVERLRSEEEQQAVFIVCTPLQRFNPMLHCDDDAATSFNFNQLAVGDALFATSSTAADAISNTAKVQRIADSLRDAGMSQIDIDRYVEGIDVNAQQRNTSGDARAKAMQDQMFRNDSTYRQMQRALYP